MLLVLVGLEGASQGSRGGVLAAADVARGSETGIVVAAQAGPGAVAGP
ncbi:hypothetical protein [Mycobacterium sp. pR1184]